MKVDAGEYSSQLRRKVLRVEVVIFELADKIPLLMVSGRDRRQFRKLYFIRVFEELFDFMLKIILLVVYVYFYSKLFISKLKYRVKNFKWNETIFSISINIKDRTNLTIISNFKYKHIFKYHKRPIKMYQ